MGGTYDVGGAMLDRGNHTGVRVWVGEQKHVTHRVLLQGPFPTPGENLWSGSIRFVSEGCEISQPVFIGHL